MSRAIISDWLTIPVASTKGRAESFAGRVDETGGSSAQKTLGIIGSREATAPTSEKPSLYFFAEWVVRPVLGRLGMFRVCHRPSRPRRRRQPTVRTVRQAAMPRDRGPG